MTYEHFFYHKRVTWESNVKDGGLDTVRVCITEVFISSLSGGATSTLDIARREHRQYILGNMSSRLWYLSFFLTRVRAGRERLEGEHNRAYIRLCYVSRLPQLVG